MGLVYQARDPKIDRVVAIKTISLHTQEIEEEQEFRQRFFLEARAAGRLSHPGIVTIFDVGEDPETHEPYIVMEFVPGQPLNRVLAGENRKLALGPTLQITQEIAEALNYAHAQGVVHRDIKPANILITRDGHPKIADFGVAKLNQGLMTLPGQVMGSPAYMAPEQLSGEGSDPRSDLFSLGVILYSMLTGFRPFQGNSTATVSFKVVNRDPLPVTSFDSEFPAELDRLVSRAIAKDPAQRYQTGMEMAQDIQRLRERHNLLEQTAASIPSIMSPAERTGVIRVPLPSSPRVPATEASATPSPSNAPSAKPETSPPTPATAAVPKAPLPAAKRGLPVTKARSTVFPKEIAVTAASVLLLAIVFGAFEYSHTKKRSVAPASVSVAHVPVTVPTPPPSIEPPSEQAAEAPSMDQQEAPAVTDRRRGHARRAPVKVIRTPQTKVATRATTSIDTPKLPASLQNVKAGPVPVPAIATLQIQIEFQFAEVEASVSIDNQLVYSQKLYGESKKKALLFKKVEGHERSTVKIPAGDHRIHVRVQSDSGQYDQSQSIAGNFAANSQNVLGITCDKHDDELQLTLQ
jgi:serine/threonine-protein kinase